MPKRFTTCAEIKDAFVKDGWNENITFEECTENELKTHYGYYIYKAFYEGRKFFRNIVSGNIYDDCGKIVYYNIPINDTL